MKTEAYEAAKARLEAYIEEAKAANAWACRVMAADAPMSTGRYSTIEKIARKHNARFALIPDDNGVECWAIVFNRSK